MKESIDAALTRPTDELMDGYRGILREYSPSCLVTDAQERAGAFGGMLVVRQGQKACGPAFTINMSVDDWVNTLPLLMHVKPGDMVVMACHGLVSTAMWGGLTSTISQNVGVAGAVVDGAIRDIDEIRDINFPVWFRTTVPRQSPGALHDRLTPIQLNVPVTMGGQIIYPGDIVVADESGVAVVPYATAEAVLAKAKVLAERENVIRNRMNSGAVVAGLRDEFRNL
jgi:regulator of RNase E activity RraA